MLLLLVLLLLLFLSVVLLLLLSSLILLFFVFLLRESFLQWFKYIRQLLQIVLTLPSILFLSYWSVLQIHTNLTLVIQFSLISKKQNCQINEIFVKYQINRPSRWIVPESVRWQLSNGRYEEVFYLVPTTISSSEHHQKAKILIRQNCNCSKWRSETRRHWLTKLLTAS